MPLPLLLVLAKEIRDRAVLVAVTGGVLLCLCLVAGALWEPMSEQFASLRDALPAAVLALIPGGDMSSATGWVNAQVISLMAPGGLIVVAVISALRGTVGEEDRGTLGLLLGAGVGRATFATAKSIAMATHVLITGSLLLLGMLTANWGWGLGLPTAGLLGATAHTIVLAWLFGALTLALALSTGRARLSAMVSIAVAATSFVVATFFPLSQTLSGWERVSPWYYFNGADPLANGATFTSLLLLATLSVTLCLLSLWGFSRRDLRN